MPFFFSVSPLHFLNLFHHCRTTFPPETPWNFLRLTFPHLRLTPLLPTTLLDSAHCTVSYHYCLASLLFSPPPPPPPSPLPPSSSPFTLTVFVALIANESQNLSVLRTCTTYLCVGQRFKDESLSTQRLYMHAFAFKTTVPDRHPRRDR